MKRLLLSILVFAPIFLAACSGTDAPAVSTADIKVESYESGEYGLRLSYPAGSLQFGQSAEIRLDIEYPEGRSYILLPPDTGDKSGTSNTVIDSIEERDPVYDGKGRVTSSIVFRLEAWLPGKAVFPPLTVRFDRDITTAEVTLEFVSAMAGGDSGDKLSPLYEPESASDFPVRIIPAAALAAAAVLSAVVLVRRKKRQRPVTPAVKTREDQIKEFRASYIDNPEGVSIRDAFAGLDVLVLSPEYKEYRAIVDRARFSVDGIDPEEGSRLVREIYERFLEGEADAL